MSSNESNKSHGFVNVWKDRKFLTFFNVKACSKCKEKKKEKP